MERKLDPSDYPLLMAALQEVWSVREPGEVPSEPQLQRYVDGLEASAIYAIMAEIRALKAQGYTMSDLAQVSYHLLPGASLKQAITRH